MKRAHTIKSRKCALLEKIIANVRHNESGCWLWQGILENGYSIITTDGIKSLGHRAVYEFCRGSIPSGLTLDHLCRNRNCINPSHLEPVTLTENIRRGTSPAAHNRKKTHCNYGHEFTTENTLMASKGSRICRKCAKRRSVQFQTNKKRSRLENS